MHENAIMTRIALAAKLTRLIGATVLALALAPWQAVQASPVAEVRGNLIHIPNGAAAPEIANGTHAGAVGTGADFSDLILSIWNSGDANLHVTGPITFSGPETAYFSVLYQPQPDQDIAPGAGLGVGLRFDPFVSGSKTVTVSIPTDDPDRNPYTFDVTGDAYDGTLPPEADLFTIGFVKPTIRVGSNGGYTLKGTLTVCNVGTAAVSGASLRMFLSKTSFPESGKRLLDVAFPKPIPASPPSGPKFFFKKIKFSVPVLNPGHVNLLAVILPPSGIPENTPSNNMAYANLTP
jgi:hypothetical protein